MSLASTVCQHTNVLHLVALNLSQHLTGSAESQPNSSQMVILNLNPTPYKCRISAQHLTASGVESQPNTLQLIMLNLKPALAS